MSAAFRRATLVALVSLAALTLAGCSAGGFGGSKEEAVQRTVIKKYVAIGDGFAAAPFVGTVDDARGCLRSKDNYPAQVAARLGATLVDVTCTGADTTTVLDGGKAPTGKGKLPAQVDAVTADTDLVTITIGVMDDQLLYRGFYVCMGFPCAENTIPATKLGTEVAQSADRVSDVVDAVQKRAPDAMIVLVGYPQITPRDKSCDRLLPLDKLQLAGVNAIYDSMNGNMQDAAGASASTYVEISKLTADHQVCAPQPWIRGTKAPEGPRSVLHPLAPEQKVTADAVVAAVQRDR
jgi:hypothetical protein